MKLIDIISRWFKGKPKPCAHINQITKETPHYNQIRCLLNYDEALWPHNSFREVNSWIQKGYNYACVKIRICCCAECGQEQGYPQFILADPYYRPLKEIKQMHGTIDKVVQMVT